MLDTIKSVLIINSILSKVSQRKVTAKMLKSINQLNSGQDLRQEKYKAGFLSTLLYKVCCTSRLCYLN